jgi:hypothetical protein
MNANLAEQLVPGYRFRVPVTTKPACKSRFFTATPVSCYEPARIARIPSSRIQETVQRLHEKGYVSQTADLAPQEGLIKRAKGRWLVCTRERGEALMCHPLDGECESIWLNSPVTSLMTRKDMDEHFFDDQLVR